MIYDKNICTTIVVTDTDKLGAHTGSSPLDKMAAIFADNIF